MITNVTRDQHDAIALLDGSVECIAVDDSRAFDHVFACHARQPQRGQRFATEMRIRSSRRHTNPGVVFIWKCPAQMFFNELPAKAEWEIAERAQCGPQGCGAAITKSTSQLDCAHKRRVFSAVSDRWFAVIAHEPQPPDTTRAFVGQFARWQSQRNGRPAQ